MFRVLIVDDEPFIRQGLRLLVPWEDYGFTIAMEASNGQEAIDKLAEEKIDLIITDIKMPLVSGLELMEHVSTHKSQNIKFILLSGYFEYEYAKKAMKYEAVNYLLKPIQKEELVMVLRQCKEELDKGKEEIEYMLLKDKVDELLIHMEEEKYEVLEEKILALHHYFYYRVRKKELIQMHLDYILIRIMDLLSNIGFYSDKQKISDIIIDSEFYNILKDTTYKSLKKFIYTFTQLIHDTRCEALGGVLGEVIKEVHENYNKPLTLKILSEKYHMNSAYLGQLFKKQYNMSFKDYLNQYRIEKGAELLKRTDLLIGEISDMIGFNSTDYFISKFVEMFSVTPLQYRKQLIKPRN